jgi:mevalonate kinase
MERRFEWPARESSGEASGKAILVGEHFVVHGAPALAIPVHARVSVRIRTGSGEVRGTPIAVAGLAAMCAALGLDRGAVDLEVGGELPLGAGLGGSAALAAAFGRALGVEASGLAAFVHRLERIAHGRPSGLDGMTVTSGLPIWLPPRTSADEAREAELGRAVDAEMLRIRPDEVPLWVAVVPRTGSTKEAVAQVAAWRERSPRDFETLMEKATGEAFAAREALSGGRWQELGALFDSAHTSLDSLGLVTPPVQALVDAARAAGAYGAKMSGAGLGGAVIAIAREGLDLGPALRQARAMQILPPRGQRP